MPIVIKGGSDPQSPGQSHRRDLDEFAPSPPVLPPPFPPFPVQPPSPPGPPPPPNQKGRRDLDELAPLPVQPPLPNQNRRDVGEQIPPKSPVQGSVQESNKTANANAGSDNGPVKPYVIGEAHPDRVNSPATN